MSSLMVLVLGLLVTIASSNGNYLLLQLVILFSNVINICIFYSKIIVIPESRIVGGSDAQPGQLLFAASLESEQHGNFCGATVISNRWIVSAASCLALHWVGSFTVRVGSHTLGRGGVVHTVSHVILHERFDYNSRYNDIALIKTSQPIVANAQTAFATVATSTSQTNGVVSGWGHTQVNGTKAAYLQYYNTPIITNANCKTLLTNAKFDKLIQNSNVCTLSQAGQGICRADSGGSLSVGNELVGIASFGVSCATGVPDVFTRVSSYSSWITTTQSNIN